MDGLQLKFAMTDLERKILSSFDAPDSRTRSLADFGDAPGTCDVVDALVSQGWLRASEPPGTYARTEEGRLQLAAPRDVTLYTRPGCTLCDEAKHAIAPLLKEVGARLTEINIDQDPHLRALYDYDVPVLFIGARKAAKHRVDAAQFRRQLRDAT